MGSGNLSMTKRSRVLLLLMLLLLGIVSSRAAGPTITIDATAASGKVSPLLYGLMTEEINHADVGESMSHRHRFHGCSTFQQACTEPLVRLVTFEASVPHHRFLERR